MSEVDSQSRHSSPDQRLTADAKALGDVCMYPWDESGAFPGITLRQQFAAIAMGALMTPTSNGWAIQDPRSDYQHVAETAVKMADALLRELAK